MKVHRARSIARLQGVFNLVSGIWPLADMRSFEGFLGPKTDRWLVYTVAGLLISTGVAQLSAADEPAVRQARRMGVGCAATLGAIDIAYAPRGRISRMYLLDAVAESGWLVAWVGTTSGWRAQSMRVAPRG